MKALKKRLCQRSNGNRRVKLEVFSYLIELNIKGREEDRHWAWPSHHFSGTSRITNQRNEKEKKIGVEKENIKVQKER